MRTLLVATTNQGKLREIRGLMSGTPVQLVGLADLQPIEEPEETGSTFEENARLKAIHYASASGLWTVAEDSGLVIDALGGEPGVLSARFLRADASYGERFAEIYRRLAAHPESTRTARFVAALSSVDGGNLVYETTGVVEGRIADSPRGSGGFGYDPAFVPADTGPDDTRTMAELSSAEKHAISHRGRAARAAIPLIEQLAE